MNKRRIAFNNEDTPKERIYRYIVLRINKSKRPLKQKTENNSTFIQIKCVLLISKTHKTTILNITKINPLRFL